MQYITVAQDRSGNYTTSLITGTTMTANDYTSSIKCEIDQTTFKGIDVNNSIVGIYGGSGLAFMSNMIYQKVYNKLKENFENTVVTYSEEVN